jgi:pimeloyl-ACP methyl ester carboxylesterase
MHVILVPGMWLAADAWDAVVPALRAAGYDVETMTLPGQESAEAARADIGFADWVDAVLARVDAVDPATPVALVGHSAAGTVVSVVADRRASRLAAVVYVDSAPFPEGDYENEEFPAVDGVIPFPDRSGFSQAMLRETEGAYWDALAAHARPVPAAAANSSFRFTDPARHAISTTVIASEMSPEDISAGIDGAAPWASELAATQSLAVVGLQTGHWAMFTRPDELASIIISALGDAGTPARTPAGTEG